MDYANLVQPPNYLTQCVQVIEAQHGRFFLRSVLWYFWWPLFFFVILAPGFILSIPPAQDCDDNVVKPIAPGRVTVQNVFVHAAIFIVIIVAMYYAGAKMGILAPWTPLAIGMFIKTNPLK